MPALLSYVLASVEKFSGGITGYWTGLNTLAVSHLGTAGPWVLWGLVAFFVLFFVSKATKLAFDLTRLVLLPSAGLSIALVMIMPCWPPMKTFPAFLAVTTAMMFLRSR